jgi:hypothetical protein
LIFASTVNFSSRHLNPPKRIFQVPTEELPSIPFGVISENNFSNGKHQAELFGLDSPIKIAETDVSGEKSSEKPKVVFYLPPNGREAKSQLKEG